MSVHVHVCLDVGFFVNLCLHLLKLAGSKLW